MKYNYFIRDGGTSPHNQPLFHWLFREIMQKLNRESSPLIKKIVGKSGNMFTDNVDVKLTFNNVEVPCEEIFNELDKLDELRIRFMTEKLMEEKISSHIVEIDDMKAILTEAKDKLVRYVTDNEAPLQTEFRWYLKNQDDLLKKYDGKIIMIKGEEVITAFEEMADALEYATDKGLLGEVMIQKCSPGNKDYTVTIHTPGY